MAVFKLCLFSCVILVTKNDYFIILAEEVTNDKPGKLVQTEVDETPAAKNVTQDQSLGGLSFLESASTPDGTSK